MEGMRHKLSLPGLGMSKCTDPSRSPALQRAGCRVLEAVCRLPRDTTPQTAELRGVREVQDGRDSACMYIRCSIRVVLKSVLYGSRTTCVVAKIYRPIFLEQM